MSDQKHAAFDAEARAFVGAEQDPKHFEIAQGRLSRSVTVDMFAGGAA